MSIPASPGGVYQAGRRALTLLELLVVLVILAVVATVAVNSLQPRVESARYEQTRSVINDIQEATIGVRGLRQADGSPLVNGFVADVGRLPRIPASSRLAMRQDIAGQEFSELWNEQSSLATNYPFRFRSGPSSPEDYSHIQLPCGWRGPYLQLPLGANGVLDAWGRPFELEFGDQASIECIVWQPTGEYDEPLICALKTGRVSVTGTISFESTEPTGVEVVLLAPAPDSSLTELGVFADEDDNPFTFTFSNVSVGMRAIHIRFNDQQLTRYIQVPHDGLSMTVALPEATNQ